MLAITNISPENGETQVALGTSIEFSIIDDGSGIDISTLIVDVLGDRAINGVEFMSGFDGINSDITIDGSNYIVLIDPENDFEKTKVIPVKIQVRNTSGDYLNFSFLFQTIKDHPIIVTSSPKHNETLTERQMISLEFEDIIDGVDLTSLNVKINTLPYILAGSFVASRDGGKSVIENTANGFIARIDPKNILRDGSYIIDWDVKDSAGAVASGEINFYVSLKSPLYAEKIPQTGFLGYFQGIHQVSDVGDGNSMLLEWGQPIKRLYRTEVFSLIYINTNRLDLFDSTPSYITREDIQSVKISGFQPGVTLSFGVKAMEAHPNVLDFEGLTEISDGVWEFPPATTISQTVYDDGLLIYVNSTSGWGQAGNILIGSEIINYSGINEAESAFIVPSLSHRGVMDTTPGSYVAGDSVSHFYNCTDTNSVIIMGTPTFYGTDGYGFDKETQYTGFVVRDDEENDKETDFPAYDLCGWRSVSPEQLFNQGQACGTYLGGESGGLRGLNLFEQMLGREEMLLDQSGEPVVLLKRIWDGQVCNCMSSRGMHPKVKSCSSCYGTGFEGGYAQYMYPRRADGRIMLSFSEAPEDLSLGSHQRLMQDHEPTAWTMPAPGIKDRDIIIRYDLLNQQEWRYEVQKVSREKLLYGKFSRQSLQLKRLDKTDTIYTFPIDETKF